MSDGFANATALLRRLATKPTAAQQRQARADGLELLVTAARAQLAANGSNKTYKLSAALGVAVVDRQTSAMGPIRGRRHSTVGHLVEFGTAPHWQPNRNGGQMHPGAVAKPFMRPAYDATKVTIVLRTGESIANAIFRG